MWSDNDIDGAFQRLNPPEPEPSPFPLDAWLRLETELDKAVIERAVRRRVWQFFAAEIAVLALAVLGWLLWPTSPVARAEKGSLVTAAQSGAASGKPILSAPLATNTKTQQQAQPVAALQPASVGALPIASPAASASVAAASSAATSSGVAESAAPVANGNGPSSLLSAVAAPDIQHKQPSSARTAAENRAHHIGFASSIASKAKARKTVRGSESKAILFAQNALPPKASGNMNTGKSTEPIEPAITANAHSRRQRTINKKYYPSPTVRATASARKAKKLPSPESEANGAAENPSAAAAAAKQLTSASEIAALPSRLVAVRPMPESALPAPLATVAVAEAPAKPELPAPARQPRFYIGLVGAPDVTTVKFASVESPLLNVGVTLEYRLTSRLRVSTGLLRAKKQYMARREDYNFGTYAPYITHRYFDDVDGTCTVVDVPLNVRYDFLAQPQYHLFGSAGLSSFFMQREQYSYAYTEYNKPGYWEGELVNQNRHLLSILNLSLGYERSLGTHWSLQAEPYFKLPLAGVGAGKLKLTSAGVFLGIKYGF